MGKVKLYRSITGATILMIPHPSYRIIPHTRAANHYSHQGEQSSTKYLNSVNNKDSRLSALSKIKYFGPRLHAYSQKVRFNNHLRRWPQGTTADDRTTISRDRISTEQLTRRAKIFNTHLNHSLYEVP